MINVILQQACDWFTIVKAPDLKEKVDKALEMINSEDESINESYKKLLGFILFDYAMHKGPVAFPITEKIARQIGVVDHYTNYAEDWIKYSDKNKSHV